MGRKPRNQALAVKCGMQACYVECRALRSWGWAIGPWGQTGQAAVWKTLHNGLGVVTESGQTVVLDGEWYTRMLLEGRVLEGSPEVLPTDPQLFFI